MLSIHSFRRIPAVVAVVLLTTLHLTLAADSARAASYQRLAGETRYGTSVAVSEAGFPAASDVIVARGNGSAFADALAASGLAGVIGAPVLLTHTNGISTEVLEEIQRLAPERVHIAGGLEAVSSAAEAQIDAVTDATIHRFDGEDRYDTAARMATAIPSPGEVGGLATAIIATGAKAPDALASGPLAYARNLPILLVEPDAVPPETRAALEDLAIEQVIILGRELAVSPGVQVELEDLVGHDAIRLGGEKRYQTAIEIADFALDSLGFPTDEVLLARADIAADALAGGPYGGAHTAALVVTEVTELHPDTRAWLTASAPELITILGGVEAMPDAIAEEAVVAAEEGVPPTNQAFAVTPRDDATLTLVAGAQTDTEADDRTYQVTGLEDRPHTVALVPAENVTVAADGTVTFADGDDDGTADGLEDTSRAHIVAVNGVVGDVSGGGATMPEDGTLTFSIDGVAPGSVRPVVYVDGDSGSDLDLDDSDAPIAEEPFGVGGVTTFRPPEADASADAPDGRVVLIDEEAQEIWVDAGQPPGDFLAADADLMYRYDDGDSFGVGGVPASQPAFLSALSRGDVLAVGAYSPDDGVTSDFNLLVDTPLAPSSVTSEAGSDESSDDITVSVVPSIPTNAALYESFVIERAPVTGGTDEADDGTPGAYETIATPTADEDPGTPGVQYTDTAVPAGVYRYRAAGVIDGDQGAFSEDLANEESVAPPEPDTTVPIIEGAALTFDNDLQGIVSALDVWTLTFSEEIATDAINDGKLLLEDPDGDRISAECGLDVDAGDDVLSLLCAPDDGGAGDGTAINMTLGEMPKDINTDGNGTIEYGLTILSLSNHFSDGTNVVSLEDSADIVVD